MENINKEKISENIDEAYKNQTDKVKELLQSARNNLADLKECPYDYITKKEKANQFHSISRVITRKKEKENKIEKSMNEKFLEMNQKLDINSKNLDFIFEHITENDQQKIMLLQNATEQHKEEISKVLHKIKRLEKQNANKNAYMMQKAEDMQKCIKQSQAEIIDNITDSLLDSNQKMKNNIFIHQQEATRKMMSLGSQIENRINELQKCHEINLKRMKEDIEQMYKQENKHAINTLLEERNNYLKELEEKDNEIRQLNYRIYQYEEKLEQEIAKRQKQNIWNTIFRKTKNEEEIQYVTQILSSAY